VIALVTFVVTLSVLVLVHELGHYLAARKSGVTVHEFGFGFPPRLFGIRRGGTLFSLNLIPFGGFVKLEGESGDAPVVPGSFRSASVAKRILILAGGVLMNLALTVVLLTVTLTAGAPQELVDGAVPAGARDVHVLVAEVAPGSPAAAAGISVGDSISSLDGVPVTSVDAIRAAVTAGPNQPHTLGLVHRGVSRTVTVTPVPLLDGTPRIGIAGAVVGRVPVPFPESFITAMSTTGRLIGSVFTALGHLVRDLVVAHRISPDLTGPIGIAVLSGQVAATGFLSVLQFIALLSVSLAVINALPLPALDGGRLLFTVIEAVIRRPVNPRLEARIHTIGFYVLLALVVVVSVKDVQRFDIVQSVRRLFP
jgi:regulator of sigma E protease